MKKELKKTSQEIIEKLQAGSSQNQLIRAGYPKSTVVYYARKLFHPERHARFMDQVTTYQRKKRDIKEASEA